MEGSQNPLTERINEKVDRFTDIRNSLTKRVSVLKVQLEKEEKEEGKENLNGLIGVAEKRLERVNRILDTYTQKPKVESEIRRLTAKKELYERRVEVLKVKIANLEEWLPNIEENREE